MPPRDPPPVAPLRVPEGLFPDDTETGRLGRATDWSRTPWGAVEGWPPALRTAAALVLHQQVPLCLCWGRELRQLYNDAYALALGARHPAAFSEPVLVNGRGPFGETEALFRRVLAGETVQVGDVRLPGAGDGVPGATVLTLSYSPVITDSGEIDGVLIAAQPAAPADDAVQRELTDSNERLQNQQMELEITNQQLQDTAAELEAQAEELQTTAAQLEERTTEAEAAQRTIEAIIESVTDGFVALNRELRFTYVNGRAAQMWGWGPESLIGRTPGEVHPAAEGSPFTRLLERVRDSGRGEQLEAYSVALRAPLEMRAYPSRDGGVVAYFTDISERRRAADAAEFLAEASRLLASAGDYQQTLASLARAAVPRLGDWCAVDVLTDPDLDAWPPAIERVAVVHLDPTKVELAANLTREFPPDWSRDTGTPGVIRSGRAAFYPDVPDEMLTQGAQSARHLELLRGLHIRSVIIVPLVARERVLGTITLVMAESERRFTEADLALAVDLGQRAGVALDNARLLRDARNANAAKTEFLRTISHELRQPLNAIRGYVDLWKLGLRGELTPAMQEDVERFGRNQEHLTALIEDLLSYTRLEAGQLTVRRAPVPVMELFARLEAMIGGQMAERGIEFHSVPCDPALAAMGDRERILQVCLNLLTNALRATASGGAVTLRCDPSPDTVAIRVADTGVGIPPDKLDAIFVPFTQLGRALNAPKEGAGLGLAIARGLSEAMGGTLTVTSTVGRGSTFSLTLPRATADSERSAVPAATGAAASGAEEGGRS